MKMKFMIKKSCFVLSILIIFIFQINVIAKEGLFSEGVKLFKEKKFTDSKFKFEQDIVFNPKSEFSYLYLAKIFKEEKNDDLQEQNLNSVILLNPKNEEAIYLLALLRIKKSDYKESDKLIQKFQKICKNICQKKEELAKKLKSLDIN